MNNKYRIFFSVLAGVFCLLQPAYTQDTDEMEQLPGEEQLPEQENSSKTAPDSSLQHNFTLIQSPHENNLDPHTASYSTEAQLLSGLYEGLFTYNPVTLDPEPAIAEEYRISRSKLRWTFKLRSGVRFSNGDPITANDVKESWLDLLAAPNAPYASLLDMVTGAKAYRTGTGKREDVGITAPDASTVVVQLDTPASHLPRLLCHHAFSVMSRNPSVTSGPFIISQKEKDRLVMIKNGNYWDAEHVYLPQITVQQSENTADNAFLFNTGSADWIDGTVEINKILNKSAIQIHAEYGTQYLFFKIRNAPWNNADFRNALLTAVPWTELRKGSLVPAATFVYPIGNYPAVNGLDYTDAEEAKELMAAARRKAGIAQDQNLTLKFAIIDAPYMAEQAAILKKAWEPLGVTLLIEKTPAEKYLDSINGWNADLFSYTWIGDFSDPLAFLELFRGGSTLNPSKWQNEKFDSLLNSAASESDENEHLKKLSQAEQLLLDDGVVLPISHPVSLHAVNLSAVGGWQSNALDLHPFKYIYFKRTVSTIQNIVMR